MMVIVMGVSGCGKTTVGRLLARELGCEFLDADDFHPAANVAKMAKGVALTDDDRWPWLDAIVAAMHERAARGSRGGDRLLGAEGSVPRPACAAAWAQSTRSASSI